MKKLTFLLLVCILAVASFVLVSCGDVIVGKGEKGTSMALGISVVPQGTEHLVGQFQKPKLVGEGGLGLSQFYRRFRLGETAYPHQLVQRQSLLPKVQILTLQIFHQCQKGRVTLVGLHGKTGDSLQSGHRRRTQTSLPGYQFPAALPLAYGEGLENAHFTDG